MERYQYAQHRIDREGTYNFLQYGTANIMPRTYSQDIRELMMEKVRLMRQYDLYADNPAQYDLNQNRLEETYETLGDALAEIDERIRQVIRTTPRNILVAYIEEINLPLEEPIQAYSLNELREKLIEAHAPEDDVA